MAHIRKLEVTGRYPICVSAVQANSDPITVSFEKILRVVLGSAELPFARIETAVRGLAMSRFHETTRIPTQGPDGLP